MNNKLFIYNTLSRKKEEFTPIIPKKVGLYVCGPTVYGDPHLGHARAAITFDLLFRYLTFLDYKVRYVRNITDVGHLENDADEGDDKIAKKAKLDDLEPMEVAQYYTNRYHLYMDQLNVLNPSIEPRASGHIIEQLELVDTILDKGFAYESKGSVYFDVEKYHQQHHYGKLSGRIIEDLLSTTRALDGQSEKRSNLDFALWKKASPEHIMRWPSKYSTGFPGWHLECSAMSAKYLGDQFDIHGGGMDLLFPHHECEIAQSTIAKGKTPARYWMHNNMITINGQKMGKSLGNFITLEEFTTGDHAMLQKSYSPMTIRFFILQAHYRSTLDFSNEALMAAEKGMQRLLESLKTVEKIAPSKSSDFNVAEFENNCYSAMNDDLNSPILIAHLFDATRAINNMAAGQLSITANDLKQLKDLLNAFILEVLGLTPEMESFKEADTQLATAMDLVLQWRAQVKANKDYATADKIRDELAKAGITVKDGKDGAAWEVK